MDEVDQLLRNARLRDELEPYIDDSITHVAAGRLPLSQENEFLESMLAWERAPAVPICEWFDPPLRLPRPEMLNDDQLHELLHDTILKLYSVRIVLECTDHLSDRQLYTLLLRDILPCCEKKIEQPRNYLHWRCIDDHDSETWLRYYASVAERRRWQEETGLEPPPAALPPYPRHMPS